MSWEWEDSKLDIIDMTPFFIINPSVAHLVFFNMKIDRLKKQGSNHKTYLYFLKMIEAIWVAYRMLIL